MVTRGMEGESQMDHQGEPGYIGAVTRMSGMAEAKTSATGESGEQDKVVMMSQDTPTEEAQGPAALAAPVGAAQQPPERKDGEDEVLSHQLEMSRSDQAGAPVLRTEEALDSLAQTGKAQATGLSRSKLDELYEKIRPGLEERYRQKKEQQEMEVTKAGHVRWDIPIKQPLLSSTPQGALRASGDVLGGTAMVAGERRKAHAFRISEDKDGYLSFLEQDQVMSEEPVSSSQGNTDGVSHRLELQRKLQREVEESLRRDELQQQQEVVRVKQECITPGRDGEEEVVDLHFPLRWNEATRSFAPPVLPASPGASVPEGAQVEGFAGADGQVLASDLPEEGECEDEQQEKEKEEEWLKNLLQERDHQIAILKETRDASIQALKDREAWVLEAKQKLEKLGVEMHTVKARYDGVVREYNEQVTMLQEKDEEIGELKRNVRTWRQQAEEKEEELQAAKKELHEMGRKLKATENAYMLQGETLIKTQQEVARLQIAPAERPGSQPPCYADSVKRELEEDELGDEYPEVVRSGHMQYGEPARERRKVMMPTSGGGDTRPKHSAAGAGQGKALTEDEQELEDMLRDDGSGDISMKDALVNLLDKFGTGLAEVQARVAAPQTSPVQRNQTRFTGKSTTESWTAWWKRFTISNSALTEEQRALALWNSLEGPALELVSGNAPADGVPALGAMVELLTACYAPVGLKDQMLGSLLQRRQKPGEKWMDYCNALTYIYNAANPNGGDSAEKKSILDKCKDWGGSHKKSVCTGLQLLKYTPKVILFE